MGGLGGSEFLRQRNLVARAEEMRRQRGTFEADKAKLDKLMSLVKDLGLQMDGLGEKRAEIDKFASPPTWSEADRLAVALSGEITAKFTQTLEERATKLAQRRATLVSVGIPDSMGIGDNIEKAKGLAKEGSFAESFREVASIDTTLSAVEEKAGSLLKERVSAVITWALPEGEVSAALGSLADCLALIDQSKLTEASECLESQFRTKVPKVTDRLSTLAQELTQARKVAKEEGIDTAGIDDALSGIDQVHFTEIDERGNQLVTALAKLSESLRPKFSGRLEKLRAVVERMREGGTDVTEVSGELDFLEKNLTTLPPGECVSRISRLGEMVEGPILRVIFSQVEEIRPYLEQARAVKRPIDGIVEGMNQTRALLNAKEYARALDSSSAALERAKTLMEDVEIARSEVEEFRGLLFKLEVAGLSVVDLQEFTTKAEAASARGDFAGAKTILREGAKTLGRQSTSFFRGQIDQAERCLTMMVDLGMAVPNEVRSRLDDLKMMLSSGNIPGVIELLSDINVKLQGPVREGLAKRLETLNQDLEALTNEEARKQTSERIAEVKTQPDSIDQFIASMDALVRVERETAGTFANEVGKAIEDLGTGEQNLRAMDYDTADLTREIGDIRQIMDTGNVLRALRSAQDLSSRVTQLSMSRAEDALAGAKLSIVEISKMISEPPDVRELQNQARDLFQAGRYLEAYRTAVRAKEQAVALQQRSQKIVERIGQIVAQITALRKKGSPVEELRAVTARIAGVRESYQKLAFEEAEAQLANIQSSMDDLVVRTDGRMLLDVLRGVLEGLSQLGVPTVEWEERIASLQDQLPGANPSKVKLLIEELMDRVLDRVRPVLQDNIKSLQSELKIASDQGIDIRAAEGLVHEADEKLKSPAAPVGVAKILAQVHRDFSQNRALQEAAQRALASAKEIVSQAEMMNLNVIAYQARLDEVAAKIAGTQFAVALDISQDVRNSALALVKEHLNTLLNNLQNVITRAKMEGTLTMTAENYLAQARNKVATNNTQDILQLVGKAESELERIELQHSIAENSLGILEGKVNEAIKAGLIAPNLAEEITEVRKIFEEGHYAEVLEQVLRVSEHLQSAAKFQGRAESSIRRVEELAETAAGLGVDVDRSLISKARADITRGEYGEAETLAKQAWEPMRQTVSEAFTRMLTEASGFLDLLPSGEEAHARLATALEQAHQAKTREDYPAMATAIDQAYREVNRATVAFLHEQQERLQKIPASYEHSKLEELQVLADVVMDNLRENHLLAVAETWKSLETEINQFYTRYIDAESDRLAELGMLCERLGLDFTPIIEKISEAKNALQESNLNGALGKTHEASVLLDSMIRAAVPEKLKEFHKKLQRARDQLNVSVAGLEEKTSEAESLLSENNFVAAAQAIMGIEQALNQRKAWQTELINLQSLLVSRIEQAEAERVDTTQITVLMDEAVGLKNRGDYPSALERLRTGLEELKRVLPPV
jgi:hypothetical protein